MYDPESVRVFFEPDGVALIGVSLKTGSGSFNIFEILNQSSYEGRIYPVNPKGGELLGQEVYPSVLEIPDKVELAVISTPRTVVLEVVNQCIQKGIKGLVIITQGFADADQWGKDTQEKILEACKQAGVRIVGPNTLGVANNFNFFSTGFVPIIARQIPIGAVSQSGIFFSGSQALMGGMGLIADLGNTSDVNPAELVEYYSNNPKVKVISLHMEDIKEGRKFIEVAQKASNQKPVIAFKAGQTSEGMEAVASHTGSLAGESEVYSAAFRQARVIPANDEEELSDLTKTFLTYPPLQGNRVGIITFAGGAGVIALDACSHYGLEAARLSSSTREVFKQLSPDWLEPENPLDMWPAAMSMGHLKVMEELVYALLEDPGVDSILMITPGTRAIAETEDHPLSIMPMLRKISSKKQPSKPITIWFQGYHDPHYYEKIEKMGFVAFPSISRAVRALGALYKYGQYLSEPLEKPELSKAFQRNNAAKILEGNPRLIGSEAFAALEAYGIPTAPYRMVDNLEKIKAAASEIDYPVVLKLISPDIVHKSDMGGVITGIDSENDLTRAYNQMHETIKEKAGDVEISGYLVQKEINEGQEVLLGIKRDPNFGPVILFGLGGIFVEIIQDISYRIAPISKKEAKEMINETRAIELLKGARGQKALDINSLADYIVALSKLAADFPEIAALDINPLRVLPREAVALDVRVEWKPE